MSDWKYKKLQDLCDVRDGTHESPKYYETGIPFITSKNLTANGIDFNNISYITAENHKAFSQRSKVERGDILFGMIGTIGKPVVVDVDFEFSIKNVALLKFGSKPNKELISNFAVQILKSNIIEKQFKNKSDGGVQSFISLNTIRTLDFPAPPLSEQNTIAHILSTVDEAIAAAEELLAKQEKMKQGLLQDLLTRGVDENGQLRPHWDEQPGLYRRTELGWIPKQWTVGCLGDICTKGGGNVQTGPFGSQLHAEDYQEQGVPIITVEHLNELSISHNNLPLVGKEDYIRLKKYDLRTGDLVFSRVGAIDRCSYVTDKEHGWLFSGRCLRVRAGNAINSKYLAFVLNSFRQRQWIVNSAVGSTMACLNTTILSNVPITVPQSYEQNFVADALFDDFIGENHLKSDLKKLEAIKTGLMQDLLTGRRRVTPELIKQVENLTHSVD